MSRILIVEDEFLSRNLLSHLIAEYGSFDTAINGNEGVEAVKRAYETGSPYDLIFLDIMMPEKNGQMALKEIRDFEKKRGILAVDGCKVVMTTALGDAKNGMEVLCSQCEAHITKPYVKKSIDEQIRKLEFPD
jgi:two-component system chemotaxis response regulator CheY